MDVPHEKSGNWQNAIVLWHNPDFDSFKLVLSYNELYKRWFSNSDIAIGALAAPRKCIPLSLFICLNIWRGNALNL